MYSPTSQPVNRRAFIAAAAATGAAAGAFALIAPAASAATAPVSPTVQSGFSSALAAEKGSIHVSQTARSTAAASFGPLKQIDAGELSIGYAEAGPADGPPVILLHGWPYDIYSFVDVTPLLAAAGYRVIVPYLRGYGTTRFLAADTFRNGQPAALATDTIAMRDALNIQKAVFGAYDWGGRTADIIAALWPERAKALVSVSGYLIGSREGNRMPLQPKDELAWWYQF